jgi:hypothetical protein
MQHSATRDAFARSLLGKDALEPDGILDAMQRFAHAVNWSSQRWIHALAVVYCMVSIFVFRNRQSVELQCAFLLLFGKYEHA